MRAKSVQTPPTVSPDRLESLNGGHRSKADSAIQPLQDQSLLQRPFVWGAGVECSFLPHLDIDEFRWTQHDRYWKEDFKRAVEETGITTYRYCFPWHVLEPQRGQFDWSYADERMEYFDKLGIELYLDVMHFGTPLWLKQAVGDVEFPEALEAFTAALVDRYKQSIRTWCPFNEPLVAALFSGDFGFWPPHFRKWRGYMPVLSRIAQAVSRGIRAIRRVDPQATVLYVDTAEHYKTRDAELEPEVRRRNLRRFVLYDLVMGRVDHRHPLFDWLTNYGFNELDIDWLRNNPQQPDIIGLDYYPHGDWQLDLINGNVRQKRADSPAGLYRIALQYYNRYGIPLMLTETSVDGQPLAREIWLEQMIEDCARLRAEGIPMLGMIWWPLIDSIDWDGALTHRVGKIHEVGLYHLTREKNNRLVRRLTPLARNYAAALQAGDKRVGRLEFVAQPVESADEQLPPLQTTIPDIVSEFSTNGQAHNKNGQAAVADRVATRSQDPVPGLGTQAEVGLSPANESATTSDIQVKEDKATDRYGIVVFSHLRWGFVWQRPQQFLSRFARKHEILFIEEPMFTLPEGQEPRLETHRVMPNVTVAALHAPASWNRNPRLPEKLRESTKQAIQQMNEHGAFDKPLLWYYSPMDSSWSLGWFENRGIVYDCMDELSQFTGAPPALIENEQRLMSVADVVFTGGYELGNKKRQQHDNVHIFGCGVEFNHFSKARNRNAPIPADIDFVARPILGWFGVIDERVDYAMIGEMARKRPDWSFCMVGPVVKVDPAHLPHSPNLFWLGSRDYQQLPDYCRAFDVCMMPFAMNKSTEYINPTKGLEYMATGRPIVSTPVRDVVRQWSDICYIASTADEFIAAADEALNNPDISRIEKGLALARENSWERTVEKMQELIRDAIGKTDRRSSRKIEPMTTAELEYTYISTPGS